MNQYHDAEASMPHVEVPLEELEYSPKAALERALELRQALEEAILEEDVVAGIMDELFDLIRLGLR